MPKKYIKIEPEKEKPKTFKPRPKDTFERQIDGVYWLAERLKAGDIFAVGLTTHDERVEILRRHIISMRLESKQVGRVKGNPTTAEAAFKRLIGQELHHEIQEGQQRP